MTSLLGLYDLFVETEDPAGGQLFTDGIEGLKTTIAGLSEAMELVRVSRIPVPACLSSAEPDALGSSGTSVGHTAVNGVCRKLEAGPPLQSRASRNLLRFLDHQECLPGAEPNVGPEWQENKSPRFLRGQSNILR
jgi:hypothetical protein